MALSFGAMNSTLIKTFGDSCVYSGEGEPVTLQVVIDNSAGRDFRQVPFRESATPGNVTTIWFKLADLPYEPKRGDEVRIGTTLYRVDRVDVEDDGSASLLIRKQC